MFLANPHQPWARREKGFALVVTLTMMALLMVVSLALLALAGMSQRGAMVGDYQAKAEANARMALVMAIGELQKELGPDRRTNSPAGMDPDVPPGNKHWLAVFDAWDADLLERPAPEFSFRRFLVSGDPEALSDLDTARVGLIGATLEMVSSGTLGPESEQGRVRAGLVPINSGGSGERGEYAWWIGDENVKAKVNAGRDLPEGYSDQLVALTAAQTAPGIGFRQVAALAGVTAGGRDDWELGDSLRAKAASLKSAELFPGADGSLGDSFHDLTTHSLGLLVDVRNGRLRRDLSLYLEQPFDMRLRQPLYTVGLNSYPEVNFTPDSTRSEDIDQLHEGTGITMEELWLYANLYKEVSHNRPASTDQKVGVIPAGYPTLLSPDNRDDVIRDKFYVYKRRVYSQVKYILSIAAVPSGDDEYDLRIVVDPVVVLWNPNNVAVEYQVGGFTTVGFSALPYEARFEVQKEDGTTSTSTVRFRDFMHNVNAIRAKVGRTHKIVLRPGESRVFSPTADRGGGTSVAVDLESGWDFSTGAVYNHSGFPKGLSPDDEVTITLRPRPPEGQAEYLTYWFRRRSENPAHQSGTVTVKDDASLRQSFPTVTTPQAYSTRNIRDEEKIPLMLFNYHLRPEFDTETPSKPWLWGNPAISYRWAANDALSSRLHLQFELDVRALDSWENSYVQITADNQAYWGGGVRPDFGVPFFTFRSIPLTPLQSLASLQHSCANGFRRHWKDSHISTGGLGAFPQDAFSLDGHQYLAPMASRVIGNSFAQPLIAQDRIDGTVFAKLTQTLTVPPRDYAIADHSYLANAALWDSWFFSSLAPQTVQPYQAWRTRTLQQVFDEFFPDSHQAMPVPLPSTRMLPYRFGDYEDLRSLLDSVGNPAEDAHRRLAAHLMVDGAFNVNSTSVTAWKSLLASLQGHQTARRDRTASAVSMEEVDGETPVNSLVIANGPRTEPTSSTHEPTQWTGFRSLDDSQIEALAEALVDEIRLRGPFLSLSDFINRRPGNDNETARHGALQAAIEKAGLNEGFNQSSRALGSIGGAPFPQAGDGSRAAGIPGYITQADLLTPLGPALQARSDTFTIRAHGRSLGPDGEVRAVAWCEAVIQRVPEYIDPVDAPFVEESELVSEINRVFGRRFRVVDFRWLKAEDI